MSHEVTNHPTHCTITSLRNQTMNVACQLVIAALTVGPVVPAASAQSPSGDTCAEAIPIFSGANGPFFGGLSLDSPECPCASGHQWTAWNVWFSYTVPCTGQVIVSAFPGSLSDESLVQVFSGTCGNLTLLACDPDAVSVLASAGQTLYVRATKCLPTGETLINYYIESVTVSCQAMPLPNDNCIGALPIPISYNGAAVSGSNAFSTLSIGPTLCGPVLNDVWYKFTANCTSTVTLDTCVEGGFQDETILQVLSGSCPNLTPVACNDDFCSVASSVSFPVTLGTTYYVRVGSSATGPYNGASWFEFYLSLDTCQPPIEDEPPSPPPPPPPPGGLALWAVTDGLNAGLSNVGAMNSAWGASACAGISSDVFLSYLAPASGNRTFTTCAGSGSLVDTIMEVYGNFPSSPWSPYTLLGCDDNACGFRSSVTASVVAGNYYTIRVGSGTTFPQQGTFALAITSGPPSNDECSGAIPLVDGVNAGLSNVGATKSAGSPGFYCGGSDWNGDVWYSYTAPCTGTATFATIGGGVTMPSPVIQVQGEGPCGSQIVKGCMPSWQGQPEAIVTAQVVGGSTYSIRVASDTGASGASQGTFSLAVSCSSPIANDECAGAIPLGDGQQLLLSNKPPVAIFISPGAPAFCTTVNSDVWYRYTAPVTGYATFTTCGGTSSISGSSGTLDTVIQVLTGTCGSLTAVGCNDNSYCDPTQMSAVTLPITQGQDYLVRVASYDDPATPTTFTAGFFDLAIYSSPTIPTNDECSTAIPISNGVYTGMSNVNATNSTGFPSPLGGNSDVWFKYVAACTGNALFSTCGNGTLSDSRVRVFSGTCGSLSSLATVNETCGQQAAATVPVVAGTTYYVSVAGQGDNTVQGTFDLTVSCCPSPSNDLFCTSAIPVSAGLNPVMSNQCASDFFSPPTGFTCGSASRDLWYSYTATCTGSTQFSLCSPGFADFDAIVSVYAPGSCTGPMVVLGCSNDSCGMLPKVTVPATAGSTYLVRVGGINGDYGSFALYISTTTSYGSMAIIPTGCGAATLLVSGTPTLGAPVSFVVTGTGTKLLWIGNAVSAPLCPPANCMLGATMNLIFPGGSLIGKIPCTPSLVGVQFSVQGAVNGALGGCGPPLKASNFTVTDTVRVTIG
jgi:hypothetical protein